MVVGRVAHTSTGPADAAESREELIPNSATRSLGRAGGGGGRVCEAN